jgi:membrane protease YdiL (CAAX protease family)
MSHRSDRVAIVALVTGLGAYDVVRRVAIPSHLTPWTNTAMIGVVAAIAGAARLSIDEMGLTRAHLRSGALWGLGAAAAVGAGVLAARGLIGPMPSLTADHVGVSGWQMLLTVFVRIPVATVLFEELAFRGTMLPLLQRVTCTPVAWIAGAATFGLWHLPPLWGSSLGSLVGTFAVTAAGGIVFTWLRARSNSLAAPMLAHWATNGLSLLILWLLR